MSDQIFELYYRKAAPYDMVHAVEVTGKNLDQVAIITKGMVSPVRTSEPTEIPGVTIEKQTFKVTFLGPDKSGVHDAELGDYVISDHAGGFIAVDKEMFETHYTKE